MNSRVVVAELLPKASWVEDCSGVVPENPRAGVLNCEAVGAAQDPNVLGVK